MDENSSTADQCHVRGNREEETDMHVDGITLVALREETKRERLRRRFTANWSTEANYGSGESNDLCSLTMSKIIGTEMTVQEETIATNGKDKCLLPNAKSSKKDVMSDLSRGFVGQYYQTETKEDEGKPDADSVIEMWALSSKGIYFEDKNPDNDDYKIENTDDTEEASAPSTSVKCEAQKFNDSVFKNETEDKDNTESRKTKHCQKEDLEELNFVIGTATTTLAVKDSVITVQFDIHVTSKIDDGKSDEENEKSNENNENDDVFVKDEEGEDETEEEDFVDDLINEDDYISIENKRNGDTAEPCYDAEDIFDFE